MDGLRGLCLVAMVVYHSAWDFHAFGFTTLDPSLSVPWRVFGDTIAAAFLFLSGLGLVLADRRGARWPGALRRLVVVAAAALAVTLATWMFEPRRVILFGILHCILLTNAIGLALKRLPVGLILALAAASAAAPALFSAFRLNASLWWIVQGVEPPPTLDYRPLLPWLAPVLLGIIFGRLNGAALLARLGDHWANISHLGAVGRHGLAIYLVHQPLLLAVLTALAAPSGGGVVAPTRPLSDKTEAAAFQHQCRATCLAKGSSDDICRSTCDCVLTALSGPVADQNPVDDPTSLTGAVSVCLETNRPRSSPSQ